MSWKYLSEMGGSSGSRGETQNIDDPDTGTAVVGSGMKVARKLMVSMRNRRAVVRCLGKTCCGTACCLSSLEGRF